MIQDVIGTNPVVQGALGAAIYGLIFFMRVRLDPDNPEQLDPVKLGTTIGLGGLFGAAFAGVGIEPTYEHVGFILTSYAGTVALVEYSVKALMNGERRRAKAGANSALEEFLTTTLSHGRSKDDVRESVEQGAKEYDQLDEDERRDAWGHEYPDEDTLMQADDEALGEGEHEGERRTQMGETEQKQERDADESEMGALPPA